MIDTSWGFPDVFTVYSALWATARKKKDVEEVRSGCISENMLLTSPRVADMPRGHLMHVMYQRYQVLHDVWYIRISNFKTLGSIVINTNANIETLSKG